MSEFSAEDLCGDYPAVRYQPPDGFGFDILTRLGDAYRYEDLSDEERDYDGVPVRVVTPRTLWRLNKDTVRPVDRFDADVLAERVSSVFARCGRLTPAGTTLTEAETLVRSG